MGGLRRRHWRGWGLVLLAYAWLAGCLCGGQTGQESCFSSGDAENGTQHPVGHVEDCSQATVSVVPLDSTDPIGWSAHDVLTANEGPQRAALNWSQLEPDTEVTVEARHLGGDVRALLGQGAQLCHELQLDVQLLIKTDDGRLDETIVTTMRSAAPETLSVRLLLPIAELNGSYDGSEQVLTPFSDPRLLFEVELSAGATRGTIWFAGDLMDASTQPGLSQPELPDSAKVGTWP